LESIGAIGPVLDLDRHHLITEWKAGGIEIDRQAGPDIEPFVTLASVGIRFFPLEMIDLAVHHIKISSGLYPVSGPAEPDVEIGPPSGLPEGKGADAIDPDADGDIDRLSAESGFFLRRQFLQVHCRGFEPGLPRSFDLRLIALEDPGAQDAPDCIKTKNPDRPDRYKENSASCYPVLRISQWSTSAPSKLHPFLKFHNLFADLLIDQWSFLCLAILHEDIKIENSRDGGERPAFPESLFDQRQFGGDLQVHQGVDLTFDLHEPGGHYRAECLSKLQVVTFLELEPLP
jgi:hypothetical protein